ncbi:MAG: hypothetical protein ACPGO5_03440 [Patescibacteria group bacterium]
MKVFHTDSFLVAGTIVVITMVGMIMSLHYSHSLGGRYAEVFEPRFESIQQESVLPAYEVAKPAAAKQVVTTEKYESDIRELLAVYNSETLNYHAAARAYTLAYDKLLRLHVPREYQDFHVALSVSFKQLVDTMNAYVDGEVDIDTLEEVRNRMNVFIAGYPWLSL